MVRFGWLTRFGCIMKSGRIVRCEVKMWCG